jgi:hypothetical protein
MYLLLIGIYGAQQVGEVLELHHGVSLDGYVSMVM